MTNNAIILCESSWRKSKKYWLWKNVIHSIQEKESNFEILSWE